MRQTPAVTRPGPSSRARSSGCARRSATRDAVIVSLLAYAGLRPGEVLALRWSDVGHGKIHVDGRRQTVRRGTSVQAVREVRLLRALATDLAAWKTRAGVASDEALVIPGPEGGPWNDAAWSEWRRLRFFPAADAAGFPQGTRPYDLRHTFVWLLLREGSWSSTWPVRPATPRSPRCASTGAWPSGRKPQATGLHPRPSQWPGWPEAMQGRRRDEPAPPRPPGGGAGSGAVARSARGAGRRARVDQRPRGRRNRSAPRRAAPLLRLSRVPGRQGGVPVAQVRHLQGDAVLALRPVHVTRSSLDPTLLPRWDMHVSTSCDASPGGCACRRPASAWRKMSSLSVSATRSTPAHLAAPCDVIPSERAGP